MMANITKKLIALTAVCYFVNFVFGSSTAIFGPSLPDLEKKLNSSADKLKYGISMRFAGYAISALLSSFLFDKFKRIIVLIAGFVAVAVSLVVTVIWPTLVSFILMQTLFGLASGVIDTACVVWTFDLWARSR